MNSSKVYTQPIHILNKLLPPKEFTCILYIRITISTHLYQNLLLTNLDKNKFGSFSLFQLIIPFHKGEGEIVYIDHFNNFNLYRKIINTEVETFNTQLKNTYYEI